MFGMPQTPIRPCLAALPEYGSLRVLRPFSASSVRTAFYVDPAIAPAPKSPYNRPAGVYFHSSRVPQFPLILAFRILEKRIDF
jgi:hypothetical protein